MCCCSGGDGRLADLEAQGASCRRARRAELRKRVFTAQARLVPSKNFSDHKSRAFEVNYAVDADIAPRGELMAVIFTGDQFGANSLLLRSPVARRGGHRMYPLQERTWALRSGLLVELMGGYRVAAIAEADGKDDNAAPWSRRGNTASGGGAAPGR